MAHDLGDTIPLSVEIRSTTGALADATAVTLTITLPDGTTVTPAVTHPSTGVYACDYAPAAAGLHAVRWVATGTNASAYNDTFAVSPAVPPLALSLADAKAHLGIPPTVITDDEELRDTIAEAQDMIERKAGVALTARTIIETHAGGSTAIALWHPPVRSITSVAVSGTTLPAGSYRLEGGDTAATVLATAGTLGTTCDQVVVTYAAGWQAPPPVVARTMKALVGHLWSTQRGSMPARTRLDDPNAGAAGAAYLLPISVRQGIEILSGPGI